MKLSTYENRDFENKEFESKVCEIVGNIPRGYVLTYGMIALLAGRPQNSRLVGRIMSHSANNANINCHRVVNHMGRTAPGWERQRQLLEGEGVTFKQNGCVDLKKHICKFY